MDIPWAQRTVPGGPNREGGRPRGAVRVRGLEIGRRGGCLGGLSQVNLRAQCLAFFRLAQRVQIEVPLLSPLVHPRRVASKHAHLNVRDSNQVVLGVDLRGADRLGVVPRARRRVLVACAFQRI